MRLLKRSQFLRLNRGAARYIGRYIIVDTLANTQPHTRLGVTVTKKFGNACKRNRFKRIVREAFRLSQHEMPSSLDLVVKPRTYAQKASMDDVKQDLLQLLSQTKQKPDFPIH